jgi:recombination protein RecR
MAYFILRLSKEEALAFANAIMDVKKYVTRCKVCFNLCEGEKCSICHDRRRDHSVICVVEEVKDLLAIEKGGNFKGVYHVLGGALSPLDGIGPQDLTVSGLINRIKHNQIKEVILATNSDLEGDTTAMYLAEQLKPLKSKVTRLAQGLPAGAKLEYADQTTLDKALEGRREV